VGFDGRRKIRPFTRRLSRATFLLTWQVPPAPPPFHAPSVAGRSSAAIVTAGVATRCSNALSTAPSALTGTLIVGLLLFLPGQMWYTQVVRSRRAGYSASPILMGFRRFDFAG
jgi:hypothetical protein